MLNLLVFGMIGLLTGATARLLYPGRRPSRILGTMLIAVAGALSGGVFSYAYWPFVDGQFQSGNLIVSLLGAIIVLALSTGLMYARSLRGYSRKSL
jgi:uncharacterized membrane protein YeaQ/YmgE (transglycosylase-associated protein family)